MEEGHGSELCGLLNELPQHHLVHDQLQAEGLGRAHDIVARGDGLVLDEHVAEVEQQAALSVDLHTQLRDRVAQRTC